MFTKNKDLSNSESSFSITSSISFFVNCLPELEFTNCSYLSNRSRAEAAFSKS